MKRPARVPTFPVGAITTVAVAPPLSMSTPLAHQGGWDEILMVVAPLSVIGLLLWIANRRVSAQIAAEGASTSLDSGETSNGSGESNSSGGDVSR